MPVYCRLIVNLTTPALILWNEEIPIDKNARNLYIQIEEHLQSYKDAFADETIWAVLSTRLSKVLETVSILFLFSFCKYRIKFLLLIKWLHAKFYQINTFCLDVDDDLNGINLVVCNISNI